MIIMLGKTASGKDTIINELVTKHGYKRVITYTTRPMRPGEQQDITYHFISEEDFKQKIGDDFFAEYKTYNTEFGLWYYGTAIEDLENMDNKTLIILTPSGYRDIIHKIKNRPKVIYIYANNATIKERLKTRRDDKNEAQRRLEHDNLDFKGVENEVDKIFYNNKGNNIDDVVNKIAAWLEKE